MLDFFQKIVTLGTALLAVLIAYFALESQNRFQELTISNLNLTKQIAVAGIRPILTTRFSLSAPNYTIQVINSGAGHAHITDVHFFWGDESLAFSEKAPWATFFEIAKRAEMTTVQSESGPVSPFRFNFINRSHVLRPGEVHTLVELKNKVFPNLSIEQKKQIGISMRSVLNNMNLVVCYCNAINSECDGSVVGLEEDHKKQCPVIAHQ